MGTDSTATDIQGEQTAQVQRHTRGTDSTGTETYKRNRQHRYRDIKGDRIAHPQTCCELISTATDILGADEHNYIHNGSISTTTDKLGAE